MKLLLIGGGGREHALAWKMAQSALCDRMWAVPGNPGIAQHAKCVDIKVEDVSRIVAFATDNAVDMVIIGPEDPLADGMGDAVTQAGILCFGPGAKGARLEADKAYAKTLMRSASVPTPEARIFTDFQAARTYVLSPSRRPGWLRVRACSSVPSRTRR